MARSGARRRPDRNQVWRGRKIGSARERPRRRSSAAWRTRAFTRGGVRVGSDTYTQGTTQREACDGHVESLGGTRSLLVSVSELGRVEAPARAEDREVRVGGHEDLRTD